MQLKAVFKIVSPTIITVGLAMIGCSFVSVLYHEEPFSLLYSGIAALVFGILVAAGTRKASVQTLGVKEGCAIATFSWLFACFFGALPFYLMGFRDSHIAISFTKAIYESVSGFTTTGSSIFTDVEILPKGILFWRSLTHWFGGMGIVVLAVAILPKLGIGGMHGFRMESPGPLKSDKLVPRISETAKILYTVYFAITVIEFVLLMMVGVNWFDSAVHTFGTVGTGGFSTYNTSIAGLKNIPAEYIIAFFMWLSGANFGLTYLVLRKGDFKTMFRDAEFKVYAAITVVSILLITGGLFFKHYNNWSLGTAFRYAFFQVPTIMTTTGYATYDFNLWPYFPLIVLMGLMFVGGSTGSTGGGLKVLRHMINFKVTQQELLKIVKPNLVTTVKIGGRAIEEGIVRSVVALTLIYLLCFAGGTFLLTFFNLDFVTAATASIANLGNVGPGLNSVGPAGNYAGVPALGLWILTFLMFIGRLEIYTVLALFIPSLWKRKA